jgi:predicted esterase YcpF (UPF0227 family)
VIVYLHGFASSGNSAKAQALIDRFGANHVWNPDLPIDPDQVYDLITKKLNVWLNGGQYHEKLVFVGTSLGAFYATYFGLLYDAPFVIVNPSVFPDKSLSDKMGININHVTKEEFMVRLCDLEQLSHMKKVIVTLYEGRLANLFIAKDDDVIDYKDMLTAYPYAASLVVKETGGHRFTEHWQEVVEKIAEIY